MKTLNIIRENLYLPKLKDIAGPASLVFTKENTFTRDIRRLRFFVDNEAYYLKPYPLDHLSILQINDKDVIIKVDPEKVGFEVGKFAGQIGFVANGKQPSSAQKTAIKDLLHKYPHVLCRYCKDVSNRYKMAGKIAEALFLTNKRILDLCRQNAETASIIKKFITSQIDILFEHQDQPWTGSREFLAEMKTVMA